MENNNFNRLDYLNDLMAAFLRSESNGLNRVVGGLNALNRSPDIHNIYRDNQKRKILEKCSALFRSQKFRILIQREKEKKGIIDPQNVTRENRDANLHKITKLANDLTNKLSEVILGDLKRKYDMSSIASKDMITPIKMSNGTIKKDVSYKPEDLMAIDLVDALGTKISIHHIGRLGYTCKPSSNEYIYKFHVIKQANDSNPISYEVFSNIDLNRCLEDSSYANIVSNTLLSNNNIELSKADGYIGELSTTTDSDEQLKVGEEKIIEEVTKVSENEKLKRYKYRYQITKNDALEYMGDKIEAIRAYKQQEQEKSQDGENR